MRGIFFDEESVRAVERRLISDGFEVTVTRERFAGEDDDEDHPWALVTDAPLTVLDLLVDQHEGWLDEEAPETPAPPAPAPLPEAPRRVHRPGEQAR